MGSKKELATILRDKGYSYNMIRGELNISISTLSNWFSTRPYKPNDEVVRRIKEGPMKSAARRHNEKVCRTKQTINQAIREVGSLSKRDLWMLGIGIYMGEGSKSIESVRIVNSDPDIIRLGMRWFRDICQLTNDNFSLSINVYPDTNPQEAIKYWSSVTCVPASNFRKTQVDIRKGKTEKLRRKLRYGTLQIRIRSNNNPKNGVFLFRRILGWTKGVANQL